MEEKKNEIRNSFRSVSGHRNLCKLFSLTHHNSKNNGFTLIEIIIVISVLGILATSLIVLIDPVAQMQKSRDSQRKTDLKQIQSALELYRADNGSYPMTADSPLAGTSFAFNSVVYMQTVPKDPKDKTTAYTYTSDGTTYTVSACVENASTTDTITDASCTSSGKRIQYTSP